MLLIILPGLPAKDAKSSIDNKHKQSYKKEKEAVMRNVIRIFLPVVILSFVLIGCGGGVSESKPIPEVKAEAQSMSADQLKSAVSKYQAAIQSKKAEIEKLTDQVKKMPVTQMMGEEAQKLKGSIQDITKSVKALSDRLDVYAQELKSKI